MAYYEYCPKHNGIEIYFDDKPDGEYLESLRTNGWRWHNVKKCWYSYASDENEEFAEEICNTYNEEYGYDCDEEYEDDEDEDEEYEGDDDEEYEDDDDIPVKSTYAISGNLIRCVDCGKNISSRASFCVNCGAPMEYIKDEYEKERIRKEKIREKEAKERAERERQKQEAERLRKIKEYLAEIERKKKEEEERIRAERERKAKEKRIRDLKALYEKDKDAFAAKINSQRSFEMIDSCAYAHGYTWKLSNKDGVIVEYDGRIREMKVRYTEEDIQMISDEKTFNTICLAQLKQKKMFGIEESVRTLTRQKLAREEREAKERAMRDGLYRSYEPTYTDRDGFIISKPRYGK